MQLYKILLSHTDSGFGGSFKNVQNYISATDEAGKRFMLFASVAPYETLEAMQEICYKYNSAIGEGRVDPLLIIPVFIRVFCAFVLSGTATAKCLSCSPSYSCTVQVMKSVNIFR